MFGTRKTRRGLGRTNGFTLIELLVVIAIIALLAAILFPVFARARENARRASCQSNLKQLMLGMVQYVQDYDNRYPGFAGYTSNNNGYHQTNGLWGNRIYSYVKSSQIFICPSISSQYVTYSSSYMMNGMLGFGSSCSGPQALDACAASSSGANGQYTYGSGFGANDGVGESIVALPSQTIALFEDVSDYDDNSSSNIGSWMVYQSAGGFSVAYSGDHVVTTAPNYPGFMNIHLDGMNMAFCDGHVKWYPSAKLAALGTSKAFCGYLNGSNNGGSLYHHNGDIDFQPLN